MFHIVNCFFQAQNHSSFKLHNIEVGYYKTTQPAKIDNESVYFRLMDMSHNCQKNTYVYSFQLKIANFVTYVLFTPFHKNSKFCYVGNDCILGNDLFISFHKIGHFVKHEHLDKLETN